MTHAEPLVRFSGVQKTYDGEQLVVRALNLDIQRGEFLSLLGPSGSGKTTTLMMLAGFDSPTSGDILLNGKQITGTPPHKRNFGMVFQNYALFPHLTVGENVAYPLTVRKVPKAALRELCLENDLPPSLNHQLLVLRLPLVRYQDRIGSLHDNDVVESDPGHEPAARQQQGVGTPVLDGVANLCVAACVLLPHLP